MTVEREETLPQPPHVLNSEEAVAEAPPVPKRRMRPAISHPETESADGALIAALGRIESLLMILVRRAVQSALEEELKDPTMRAIYEATGEKTAREIAQAAGVGVATVSRTWSRWESLGLVVKEGARYRRPF